MGDTEAGVGVITTSARLRLLPDFEFHHHGAVLDLSRREQRVLALLALAGRPMHRSTIAGQLWPDATQEHASMSLRSTLVRLRRRIDPPVIELLTTTIALAADVDVDWLRAMQVCEMLLAGGAGADPIDLLRHPLLGSWSEHWLDTEQAAFAELRVRALEIHSHRLSATKQHAGAIQAAMLAIAAEPLRESSYVALITAQLGEGNRGAAMRTFDALSGLLRRELGVPPSFVLRLDADGTSAIR